MQRFLILGGDSRQLYLYRILTRRGFTATIYDEKQDAGLSLEDAVHDHHVILGPIPFSKDGKQLFSSKGPDYFSIVRLLNCLTPDHILFGGNIPDSVTTYTGQRQIPCHDYMHSEELAMANTVATAEGAILEAIRLSPRCLHGSNCLVTGFGRCGRTLAVKLKGLDARVTVADRDRTALSLAGTLGLRAVDFNTALSEAERYDMIFNTIPAPVIDRRFLESADRNVSIIDLASAPGGVDFDGSKELGIQAKLCPGLPGTYSPQTSAEILFQEIVKIIS